MIKKIYIVLCVTGLFNGIVCFAQQQTPVRDIRNHPDLVNFLENGKTPRMVSRAELKVSEYQGMEPSLSKFFYYDLIPSDFPKSLPEMSREEYVNIVNQWFTANPSRIRPDMIKKRIKTNGEIYENNN